ncbi:dihydrofolate reductase [uncultured Gelidibacter sp.]|uniref:dihydrofolate reductase n=1 Tax=uncultured Gelidibacter sp. TaxID=259318 RepID=UPI002615F960|nr:dihydrofolate reductase [uncultured Gelidibacter sp.]
MFGKKKPIPQIDKEQLQLIENAQRRIKQKKRLYFHFVIFLIGAIFLIILNTVLGVGEMTKIFGIDWFVFAILAWLFLFVFHLFNVFITHKFMGKDWEEAQLTKLVAKQKARIESLQAEVEKMHPVTTPSVTASPVTAPVTPEKKTKVHKNLTLIVAAGENDAIGKDNKLIWHLSDDLKRFKTLTSDHCIIMGRKTFETFPKPLPNRTHIVITRQPNYSVPDGVIVVHNLEDALDAARNDVQPFIIGGGEIYRQAMPYADKIELTRVHENFVADTFFPKIDTSEWVETENKFHQKDDKHPHSFSFITYQRR